MPPIRPWHVLLVCLALVVPIQAGAFDSRGGGLSVSASLGQCGVSGSGVVCRIDVSWSGVEHATRYDATVTLADGSVQDLGTVGGGGGGSTAAWVPYAGSGTYTVSVTAWGSDPEGKDEKLEDDDAEAVIEDETADDREGDGKDDDAGNELEQPDKQPDEAGGGEGGGQEGGQDEAEADPAPTPEEPPAEPQDDETPPPPPTPDQKSDSTGGEPSKAPQETNAQEPTEQKASTPGE